MGQGAEQLTTEGGAAASTDSRCAAWRPVVLAVALAASPLACQTDSGDSGPRPNIILISIDTLRADHLGSYGYERQTSPFLDSLAARGVRFENAFAQSSWTLPSHLSLVTSLNPIRHGVHNEDRALADGIPTIATALKDAGYATSGFVSWIYLSAKYGFGRGFDHYHELLPHGGAIDATTRSSVRATDFVDAVLERFPGTVREDQPFFLFLHLFDPHINYDPPLEVARRFDPTVTDTRLGEYDSLKPFIRGLNRVERRIPAAALERVETLYDAEIRYVDGQLQRLFSALAEAGLLEDTVVAVTSDHGEEFDDHGSMEGHQWTLYDEVLRVPLIVALPGDQLTGTVTPLVRSIDITPTLLELASVPAPADIDGESLLGAMRGEPHADPTRSFAEIRRFNLSGSIRTERYKLIDTFDSGVNKFGLPMKGGVELYDLRADPLEQNDISASHPEVVRRLSAELKAYVSTPPRTGAEAAGPTLSEEELERLRSVGYVGQ